MSDEFLDKLAAELAKPIENPGEPIRSTGGFIVPEAYRKQVDGVFRDVMPSFTAHRGGIDFTPRPKLYMPGFVKRWRLFKARVRRRRELLALRLAPWLARDPYDDW
jgi:hypothetical protein